MIFHGILSNFIFSGISFLVIKLIMSFVLFSLRTELFPPPEKFLPESDGAVSFLYMNKLGNKDSYAECLSRHFLFMNLLKLFTWFPYTAMVIQDTALYLGFMCFPCSVWFSVRFSYKRGQFVEVLDPVSMINWITLLAYGQL